MTTSDEFLLRTLADNHLACPVCHYDLHCMTAPRCPECGRPLTLVVRQAHHPWPWVAALCGSAIAAGLGLVLLCIILLVGPARARAEIFPHRPLYDLLFLLPLLMIPAPPLLLVARRPFQSLPRHFQLALAVGLGLVALVTLVALATHLH